MTGIGIVRFIFIRNCRRRINGLRMGLGFFCSIWLANINITPFKIIIRWRWSTFLSRFFLPFWYIYFRHIFLRGETGCTWWWWCSEWRIREFSTLLYRPCDTNGSYRKDCAGGMYLDSGHLYRSSLRAYARSGWYVKIRMSYELYGWFGMPSIRIESVH